MASLVTVQSQTTNSEAATLSAGQTVANPFQLNATWWEDDYVSARNLTTAKDKGKGKEVALDTSVDDAIEPEDASLTFDDLYNTIDDVQWKQYDPPHGLYWDEHPDEVIARVIRDSITRVQERIVRELEEEELRRAQDAASAALAAELQAEADIEQHRLLQQQATTDVDTESNDTSQNSFELPNTNLKRTVPLPRTASQREPYVLAKRTLRKDIPAEIRSLLSPHTANADRPPRSRRNRSIFSLWRSYGPADKAETSSAGAARGALYRYSQDSGNETHVETTQAGKTPIELQPVEVECVSCLDDFDSRDMIKAPCHSYCVDCFERLIAAACENEQQWPAKCCLNKIPDETIAAVLRGDMLERWRNRGWEWGVPVSERVYCSEPACSAWCRPHEIDRAQNVATCGSGHRTCLFCRGEEHGREACPQDRELARTNELAEEEGWKRCYGCNAFVEHREACQHMTCRCGAEFCYVCSARWRTCHCTMEQLAEVKSEADRRRVQREILEAEKEAELQEILRQIEEFEREIALKTELLRLEQERIAEERRQKELAERIQQEQARRQEVVARFLTLREMLDKVHEMQRQMVADTQSQEDERHTTEHSDRLNTLKERHAEDQAKLLVIVEDKIKVHEANFEAEYAARLADERGLEAEYASQLKLYWAGKPDGQRQLESALKAFQIKMDAGFKAWRKWMDSELETHSWQLHEEHAIQAELMGTTERRLREAQRVATTAHMQRRAGQLRWVDVVIKERDIMLREMENAEIHSGDENIDAWFAEAALTEESVAVATGATLPTGELTSDAAAGASNDIGVALSPGEN